MKFGKVTDPHSIDAKLPVDHPQTLEVLGRKTADDLRIYIGFPTWSKAKLPGFYPRGTKNELAFYSTQLSAIEFNASFYRIFSPEQFEKWRDSTPDDFRFYPKMVQNVSHWRKLKDCDALVDEFIHAVSRLEHKLGTVFLQMQETFSPKSFNELQHFVERWPKGYPLAVELRHEQWHADRAVMEDLNQLLVAHAVDHIVTDSLGRRDMVHMRLTTPRTFVRFAAADHPSDRVRLSQWVQRMKQWSDLGLEEAAFFIHQNTEKENPLLANHLIHELNTTLGTSIRGPKELKDGAGNS